MSISMITETDWDAIMQIQSQAPFWQRYGFSSLEPISVCPSYGQGAKLMALNICCNDEV